MKAGFEGAPLSFILFVFTAIFSFFSLFEFFGKKQFILLDNHVLVKPWCLFTYYFVNSSISQTIYSLLLIYNFRVLERRWSTLLFAKYFILSYTVTTLLSFILLKTQQSLYTMMPFFTLLVIYYYNEIYPVMKIKFLNFQTSDNVFVYFSYFMMFLVNPTITFFPMVIGVVITLCSYSQSLMDGIPILPRWLIPYVTTFFEKIESIPSPTHLLQLDRAQQQRIENRFMAEITHQNQQQQQQQQHVQTRDDKIRTITDCGFTPEQAAFALNNANDDVEQALTFLIDNANY
ncbi:UBA domain-containing protein [Entamoeba marina]